ncbi:MAG TPA: hypothetical protein VMH48_10945 [Methylomirabilota bacterium]|nr:hypothetical protein [Methylomirabilota bacterium]
MSLRVFLAICILGCDFMLYVLFQWLYGEKHRKHSRKSSAKDTASGMQESGPHLVKPEKNEMEAGEKTRMALAGNATLHAPAA